MIGAGNKRHLEGHRQERKDQHREAQMVKCEQSLTADPELWQAQQDVQAAHAAQPALAQADVIQLPQHASGQVWVAPHPPAGVQPQLLQGCQPCEGLHGIHMRRHMHFAAAV